MGKQEKRPAPTEDDLFSVTTEATTNPPKRSREETEQEQVETSTTASSSSTLPPPTTTTATATETPIEVEIDEQEINTCTATELYEFASEELNQSEGDADRAAVAQKLLEAALEKFEAEHKAGEKNTSVSFLHQYASCLGTIGNQMIVLDYVERGIVLLEQALELNKDQKSTLPTDADILSSFALALADKARVVYMLDDDDADDNDNDGDDIETATEKKVKEALAASEKKHKESVALLESNEDKVEKMVGLSRALLRFAQDLDDDAEAQKQPLQTATTLASEAVALAPSMSTCTTQYGVCLLSHATAKKAIEEYEMEDDLLKQAQVQFKQSLQTEHTAEKLEAMQMLGSCQLRIAHMVEDDDEAETLIMEAIQHYETALKLDPENPKLAQLVKMMGQ